MKSCYDKDDLPACNVATLKWKRNKIKDVNSYCEWSPVRKSCVDFNCSDYDGIQDVFKSEKPRCEWEHVTKLCLGEGEIPSCSKVTLKWKCNKLSSICDWSKSEKTCKQK